VAGDIVLTPTGAYGEDHIEIFANPNLTHYEAESEKSSDDTKVRQLAVTHGTDNSRRLAFHLGQQPQHTVRIRGKSYNIRLLSVGSKRIEGQAFLTFEFDITDADVEPEGIMKEGSINFFCRHEHKDWTTNENQYTFDGPNDAPIRTRATKHTDRTLEIRAAGPLGEVVSTRQPLPECDERGAMVTIT